MLDWMCSVGTPAQHQHRLSRSGGRRDATAGAAFDGIVIALGGESKEATILDGVPPALGIRHHEGFSPIARVTVFDTDEEAPAMATDTECGRIASSITSDHRGGEILAEHVKADRVHGDDTSRHDQAHDPFSGMGASGGSGKWGRKVQ